jgi:hypothetical protein
VERDAHSDAAMLNTRGPHSFFAIVIFPQNYSLELVKIPQSSKLSSVKMSKSYLTAAQCAPRLASACYSIAPRGRQPLDWTSNVSALHHH